MLRLGWLLRLDRLLLWSDGFPLRILRLWLQFDRPLLTPGRLFMWLRSPLLPRLYQLLLLDCSRLRCGRW